MISVRFCHYENLPQAPENLATLLAVRNTFFQMIGDVITVGWLWLHLQVQL